MQKNRLLHFLPFLQTVTINRGKSSDCCCYVKAIVYVALIQSCCFLLPNTVQNWLWNVKELASPVLLCRRSQGAADSVDYETWSADVASHPASYFTQLQYNTSLTRFAFTQRNWATVQSCFSGQAKTSHQETEAIIIKLMTAHTTMGTSTGRADLTAFPIFSPGNVCWFTGDRDHGDPITGCLNWLQVMLNVICLLGRTQSVWGWDSVYSSGCGTSFMKKKWTGEVYLCPHKHEACRSEFSSVLHRTGKQVLAISSYTPNSCSE